MLSKVWSAPRVFALRGPKTFLPRLCVGVGGQRARVERKSGAGRGRDEGKAEVEEEQKVDPVVESGVYLSEVEKEFRYFTLGKAPSGVDTSNFLSKKVLDNPEQFQLLTSLDLIMLARIAQQYIPQKNLRKTLAPSKSHPLKKIFERLSDLSSSMSLRQLSVVASLAGDHPRVVVGEQDSVRKGLATAVLNSAIPLLTKAPDAVEIPRFTQRLCKAARIPGVLIPGGKMEGLLLGKILDLLNKGFFDEASPDVLAGILGYCSCTPASYEELLPSLHFSLSRDAPLLSSQGSVEVLRSFRGGLVTSSAPELIKQAKLNVMRASLHNGMPLESLVDCANMLARLGAWNYPCALMWHDIRTRKNWVGGREAVKLLSATCLAPVNPAAVEEGGDLLEKPLGKRPFFLEFLLERVEERGIGTLESEVVADLLVAICGGDLTNDSPPGVEGKAGERSWSEKGAPLARKIAELALSDLLTVAVQERAKNKLNVRLWSALGESLLFLQHSSPGFDVPSIDEVSPELKAGLQELAVTEAATLKKDPLYLDFVEASEAIQGDHEMLEGCVFPKIMAKKDQVFLDFDSTLLPFNRFLRAEVARKLGLSYKVMDAVSWQEASNLDAKQGALEKLLEGEASFSTSSSAQVLLRADTDYPEAEDERFPISRLLYSRPLDGWKS